MLTAERLPDTLATPEFTLRQHRRGCISLCLGHIFLTFWASLVALMVKNPPEMQGTWFQSPNGEDPLEEGMAAHPSTLAWRILWTEQAGGLHSVGSQRVGHNRRTPRSPRNVRYWCLSDACFMRRKAAAAAESLQSCPTLCDPRDGCPPGSPVPAILQARTLEWVAISFSSA